MLRKILFAGLLSVFLLASAKMINAEPTYTSNSITVCDGGICGTDITGYERFWKNQSNNGNWEEINESFRVLPSGKVKTRRYHYSAEVDQPCNINTESDLSNFTMKMLYLFDLQPYLMYTLDNVVVCGVWDNYVHINYTYHTGFTKEEIVFEQPLPLKGKKRKDPFNISFSLDGSGVNLSDVYACDAVGSCIDFDWWRTNDTFTFTVPTIWLLDESRVYPVVVDPSIVLSGVNVTFDGYVTMLISEIIWTRFGTSNPIQAGHFRNADLATEQKNATLYWSIPAQPTGVHVSSAIMQLRTSTVPSSNNNADQFRLREMVSNIEDYPNDASGNFLLADDTGNATAMSEIFTIIANGKRNFTINAAGRSILEGKMNNSISWFGIGLQSQVSTLSGVTTMVPWEFRPSEAGNVGNRPHLYITFEVVGDSCTYLSGDWNVDCNDNCSIIANTDVGGNDINIIGSGTFVVQDANITNWNKLHVRGDSATEICRVTTFGGGFK